MNIEDAVEALWKSTRAGAEFPAQLKGTLTLDQASRIQLGMLARKKAEGETQAGWKVGLTSASVRKKFGSEERPFGHIMAHKVFKPGETVQAGEIPGCGVEAELCFTLGETLREADVTPEQVRAAMASVHPAFEILERRGGGGADFPLAVADGLSQWGIVVGPPVTTVPSGEELARVTMEMTCNGEVTARVVGEDVIDDHFLSLSLLVGRLAEYGLALEEGQRVITGSYTKHDPQPSQKWQAQFSGIGEVSLNFS